VFYSMFFAVAANFGNDWIFNHQRFLRVLQANKVAGTQPPETPRL
jgi:hypothetical protein